MSKTTTDVDELAQTLIERIKSGVYAPGQRLIEADLIKSFDIGRSRLRETFRVLAGQGYLTIEKNRGVCVRRFTRQEAIERAHVREMLEGLLARQSAESPLNSEAKNELKTLQGDLDKAAEALDIETYAGLNERFHSFIIEHAGNEYARTMLQHVSIPVFRFQFTRLQSFKAMFERNIDHQAITDAILREDGEAAEAAMRLHLRNGIAAMSRLSDEDFA